MSALFAIIIMIVMNEFKQKLLGFKEVASGDAVRMINHDDAVMLDVRDDTEYGEGHVINAVHIPLGLLDSRLDELEQYRDKPLIVYCRTGQRSAKAGSTLQKQGFKSVYKLKGGMMAWTSADLPVSKS